MKHFYLVFFYLLHASAIRIAPIEPERPELAKDQSDEASFWSSVFTNDPDLAEGEAEYLTSLLKEAGVTPSLFKRMTETMETGVTGRMRTVSTIAMIEEGMLDKAPSKEFGWGGVPSVLQGKVSEEGFKTPKMPRSWVRQILAMNHTKTIRYMFSGSYTHMGDLKFRRWLPNFVKTYFGPEDYFRATDAGGGYKPLGVFDKSKEVKGYRPKSDCKKCVRFDESYWSKMVQSKFIVAPGGDAPFSFRFYEAVLAGAIPVINSEKTDWQNHHSRSLDHLYKIGYQYVKTTDALPTGEDYQKIADLNLKKFMRYQTFIEGDNSVDEDKAKGLYPTL